MASLQLDTTYFRLDHKDEKDFDYMLLSTFMIFSDPGVWKHATLFKVAGGLFILI